MVTELWLAVSAVEVHAKSVQLLVIVPNLVLFVVVPDSCRSYSSRSHPIQLSPVQCAYLIFKSGNSKVSNI